MDDAMTTADDMAVAMDIADRCDAITFRRFTDRSFTVAHKHDHTEVTDADREAERTARELLARARPDDSVLGEEEAEVVGDRRRRWVIDPIDGTSGFARGIPIWATLIALEVDDEPVVAVISAPALGRRWWATTSVGTRTRGPDGTERQCTVSQVNDLADAQVSVTVNDGWAELGRGQALWELMLAARRSRALGDFWQHCLVAEGALDVAVDAVGLQPYDVAAPRLIVTAAGGRLSDVDGVDTHQSPTAISTNGVLHDEVLRRLSAPLP